jgi:putative ABC transport system permease protein
MTLFKTGLRYLLRRPFQSILCILGVALGVAVVIAIDLANGSASRAFTLSTETVAGKATHQIVGSANGLDEGVYRRIKVELGIKEAAPVVSSYATAIELDQQPLRVLGIDAFADAPFRAYLGEGNQAFQGNDLTEFFTSPDAMLIGEATAQRYKLEPGSKITLRIGDRRQDMRVIGILKPADDNSRRALDGLAIVDISTAQQLFDMIGRLSHIDLIADERTPEGRAILERVRSVLPEGAQVVKPAVRSQSVESLTDAFRLNLTALSMLALVVGMFLIYNTITFSVVQRRPIIGTLRCLGVTQGEIFRQILIETLLLGAIGGLIGVGLGIVLGRGAVGLVTQTINDLYYVVNVRSIDIDPLTLLKGFGLGLVASLAAALLPAYEATSIPPITALKRSNVEQRVRKLLPIVAVVGIALFALGSAMLLLSHQLAVNLGGIFFVLIGVALVSPVATVAMMGSITPVLGRLAGVIGRMSSRSVVNSISRTAIAIASLMVAVSVIIGLQSMINSFRTTVESWLETSLTADIYIAPATNTNAGDPTIDPGIVEQFRAAPGVLDVTSLRRTPVEFQVGMLEGPATLLSVQSDRERPTGTYVWTERNPREIWRSMQGKDEVQVSEPFANKHGITPQNNVITLRTERSEKPFRVVGVYYDYASDAGVILMRRDTYQRYWDDDKISSLALYLADGVGAGLAPAPSAAPSPGRGQASPLPDPSAQIAERLRKQFAGRELVISANRELRANALQIFDRTFAITGALNLLATVVAFIGVLSALMALQIERTRELGMLRANGMTLGQLWRMTLLETGLMGGTAGLLSMPTGFLLALVLVYIINLRSFGWTIQLTLQWQTFAQAMLVAVVSALLAAIYPMLRLGRIQIASAVRQE